MCGPDESRGMHERDDPTNKGVVIGWSIADSSPETYAVESAQATTDQVVDMVTCERRTQIATPTFRLAIIC